MMIGFSFVFGVERILIYFIRAIEGGMLDE